jgi:hypothetical protein
MYTDASYDIFYTQHFPLLSPLLLTWHPPVVTGIVHLSPRLLVNYPLCPPLLPCSPPPQIPNPPGFPGPNVLLIRAHHNPLSSMQNMYFSLCLWLWRGPRTPPFLSLCACVLRGDPGSTLRLCSDGGYASRVLADGDGSMGNCRNFRRWGSSLSPSFTA